MHIPDGFLSAPVVTSTWVLSAGSIGYAARRARRELGEMQVPLMGVLGAFIFAAQMLNFRVAGGTSGHFLGAALATIVLGPWAASLVITSVLIVQALLFQDGGILALAANVLNMAIIGVFIAHLTNKGLQALLGNGRGAGLVVAFVVGWLSVVGAALACATELALSGAVDAGVVFTAMGSVHALIGIGEGLITAAVLAFLLGVRPDLVQLQAVRA
ncbi:MAG: energy-coupling factor ABC transporter permease [Anaerolineae bacterium]